MDKNKETLNTNESMVETENIEEQVLDKVDNTQSKTQSKSKLDKLKELQDTNKLGGKGSIRRKKIPNTKTKEINNEFIEKMDDLLQKITKIELSSEHEKLRNDYLSIFHKDFIRRLRKDDRKNNKSDNITEIKSQLTDYFKNNTYDSNLSNYVSKNLNDGAINILIKLLTNVEDILFKKEYIIMDQGEMKLSDQLIVQSFKTLDIDFSEPTTAFNVRSVYIEKSKNEEKKNRLDQYNQAYYVLISLIKSTYE